MSHRTKSVIIRSLRGFSHTFFKMAASISRKVHVEYDGSDSGSEGDSEASEAENDIEQEDIDNEETTQNGEQDDSTGKKGLADVLAKILHKKVANSQQVILAKGKTDKEILKRKLEREEEDPENKSAKTVKTESALARAEKIKIWENMNRSKPDPLNKDKERNFQKIATRGVVQLFNAVKKQQKLVEEEIEHVGKSDRKKDKVMEGMTKDKFLNILKGSSTTNVKQTPVEPKPVSKAPVNEESDSDASEDDDTGDKKWGALREDYMMGAKMKDWSKEGSDDGENDESPEDPDLSDSD